MTPLRQQFIRELVLRGMAPRTQDAYVAAVYGVAKHYHQSPEQLSDEQLKEYMFHLARDKDLAYSTLNQVVSGLRCFYQLVLHRSVDQVYGALPRVAKAIRRPQVFSGKRVRPEVGSAQS